MLTDNMVQPFVFLVNLSKEFQFETFLLVTLTDFILFPERQIKCFKT